MRLEDFLARSSTARDIDELYRLLEEALADLCGYDRVIFSLMSDHPSLGLDAGHGVMRNYPDAWMKHYVEHGYEHLDPVRRFGFRKVGPFIWDSLPLVMDLAPAQVRCMNECQEAGFHNGAAICLRGVANELGGIGVASSAERKADGEKTARYKLGMLNMIAQQFYAAFCQLHERQHRAPMEIILTPQELTVLEHMARAKTDDMIAFDMNLTRHAVDFHVRKILRKMRAPNRMSAVLRAISSGVLSVEPAAFIRRPGH